MRKRELNRIQVLSEVEAGRLRVEDAAGLLGLTQIIAICHELNATPRKCLGYRTSAEVFREKLTTEGNTLPS